MYIKKIFLDGFRNYDNEETVFSENINMITGENAQGKTNLLESIYFTSFGKSFRTNKEKEMIMIGRDYCRISALYVIDGDETKAEIALSRDGRKAAKIDGRKVEKISELISSFLTVIFSPEDLKIVKDEPEKRRKFIDSELCQLSLSYFEDLSDYKRILAQRNKYLKNEIVDSDMLDIWDESLADKGVRIIKKRKDFVDRLSLISENIHSSITNGKEKSEIEYHPSIEYTKDIDENKKLFLKELKECRQRDMEQGSTHSGPHRDDIDIKIEGMSTRRFGSQGQQRTVALSMKLAEIELIKEEKNDYPVLLLDDVFSELDMERQRYLVEYLKRMQVFITSAEISEKMDEFFPESKRIVINKGTIYC